MPRGATLPILMRPELSPRAEAALAQAVLLASVPATARQAVPDAVLAGFAPPRLPPAEALRNPWAAAAAATAPAVPALPDPRERAVAAATGLIPPGPPPSPQPAQAVSPDEVRRRAPQVAQGRLVAVASPLLADGQSTEPAAVPITAAAARRATLPAPHTAAKAPSASLPPRRIPVLPAIPTSIAPASAIRADLWGVSLPARARPLAKPPSDAPPFAAPYDTLTAGALAGIAAASELMRRNGLGGLRDPGALDRLTTAIERANVAADHLPPRDGEDYQRLMQWCGLARQALLLRTRFGLSPWDPDQQPALAEASHRRARWLAERPPWPGRAAAAAGLEQWLPLVDCAEALDLPMRGDHALRNLGRALRNIACRDLPRPHDLVGLARTLATQDAMAVLRETIGLDPASEAGVTRLTAMARGLESLPDLPPANIEGVVDATTLARLHRLDRSQADDLDLQDLTGSEIPLLSRGLPMLAALDARRRYSWRTAKT